MSQTAAKPEPLQERQATRPSLNRYRPLIVLVAYMLSTSLYLLALRVGSSSQVVVSILHMLGFLIPDVMVIKLLGSPHPVVERFLLNFVGPLSLACAFHMYLYLTRDSKMGAK
jgi:hypothetical protein